MRLGIELQLITLVADAGFDRHADSPEAVTREANTRRDIASRRYRVTLPYDAQRTSTDELSRSQQLAGKQAGEGEVGVLRDFLSRVEPCSNVYLIIEHEGEEYMGALLRLIADDGKYAMK